MIRDFLNSNSVPYNMAAVRDESRFQETLVKELENKMTTQLPPLDINTIGSPSSDEEIMNRVGCTASCYWCGAVCWGQWGHDHKHVKDRDTKRHHSSHQPQGLGGTSDKASGHLRAWSCHQVSDDVKVYFKSFQEGMSWLEAKQNHFSEWTFTEHLNTEFDELMKWFFQMLHTAIGEKRERLPATDDDLEKYGCKDLDFASILAKVRQDLDFK